MTQSRITSDRIRAVTFSPSFQLRQQTEMVSCIGSSILSDSTQLLGRPKNKLNIATRYKVRYIPEYFGDVNVWEKAASQDRSIDVPCENPSGVT